MLKPHHIVRKLTKYDVIVRCNQCQQETQKDYYTALKSRVGHMCKPCSSKLALMFELDAAVLREFLHYCPESGALTHKVPQMKRDIGADATQSHSAGYRQIRIGRKNLLAHRVIWLMVTGSLPDQIDHINHDKVDNRWSNLRGVEPRTNIMNMPLKKNNTSGHVGVRVLPSGRFAGYIMVHRKQISLGTYDTFDEAVAARQAGCSRYGFHRNHGKQG